MDIAKIEAFLMLMKTKHFSKAADELYISQPALTKRIRALENTCGAPLFNRSGNHISLTPQGEAFKEFAEQIAATWYGAKEYIHQFETMTRGTLNFGTTNFIGAYILPQIIAPFKAKYPNIEINMTIASSKHILDKLRKNELEFIFLSDYINYDKNNLSINDYLVDHIKLIVGSKHPLFHQTTCSLWDVQDDLFITKNKNSSLNRFIEQQLSAYHFAIRNKITISTQTAIKESVIHHLGVSLISDLAVKREVETGYLRALDFQECPITRTIQYLYVKNRYLTPAAKTFLDLL